MSSLLAQQGYGGVNLVYGGLGVRGEREREREREREKEIVCLLGPPVVHTIS